MQKLLKKSSIVSNIKINDRNEKMFEQKYVAKHCTTFMSLNDHRKEKI